MPWADANPPGTVASMGKSAKDPAPIRRDLPAARQRHPPRVRRATAPRARRTASPGQGLSLAAVLELPCLAGAEVLAGPVRACAGWCSRLNVMEVPDILPWVKPHELLLTTGYPLRDVPAASTALVAELDAPRPGRAWRSSCGRYLDELPAGDARGGRPARLPAHRAARRRRLRRRPQPGAHRACSTARPPSCARARGGAPGAGPDRARRRRARRPVRASSSASSAGPAMVTTPDGRVLASAGEPRARSQLASTASTARAGCITEAEPVGPRPPARPGRHTAPSSGSSPGALDHGRIVAFSCRAATMTDDDVHLLERAATVAALAITKAQAVSAVESKYRADFLRDALAGRAGAAERGRRPRRLARLGHRPPDGRGRGRDSTPTTTPSDAVDPDGAALGCRSASRRPGSPRGAVRDPQAPVVGFSQEVVAAARRARDADSETTDRAWSTSSPARSAATAAAAAGPSRPGCPGRIDVGRRPAPGLRAGPQGGARRAARCTAAAR